MDEKKEVKKDGNRRLNMEMKGNPAAEYGRDFLILRNAIMDNCVHCIRDCGVDCLDARGKPMENINCPLQKVRMDYDMIIHTEDLASPKWRMVKADEEMRI